MANPTLQIGNNNWAIKEDNLLGYSTIGTNFLPQPITMTRASAGTRVNYGGFIETVELVGPELITNGDFATDSNWIKGTGWTISNGSANGLNATGDLYQENVVESGKYYEVTYTISNYDSGSVRVELPNNSAAGIERSANGTYTEIILSVGTLVLFDGRTSFTGSIGNVSVKESTRNNLARINYDNTVSSLLAEPQRTNLLPYSEDFENSDWSKIKAGTGLLPVVSSNSTISPDGTKNASQIVFDAGTGTTSGDSSQILDAITFTNNTVGTSSIYLKGENGGEKLVFRGVADSTYTLLTLTTEWQRFSTTENSGTNTDAITFGIRQNVSGLGIINSSATVYAWGAQIEEGSFSTSYIPTSGSSVTRVKDQYTKTGISNLIGQTEGVIFMDWIMNHQSNSISEDVFTLSVTDGTTNNLFVINNYNNALIVYLKAAGTNQFYNNSFSGSDGLRIRLAFAYKVNDFSLVINGSVIATDNSGSVPLLNKININDYETALANDSILVKDFKLYTTRLTDSELIALTT